MVTLNEFSPIDCDNLIDSALTGLVLDEASTSEIALHKTYDPRTVQNSGAPVMHRGYFTRIRMLPNDEIGTTYDQGNAGIQGVKYSITVTIYQERFTDPNHLSEEHRAWTIAEAARKALEREWQTNPNAPDAHYAWTGSEEDNSPESANWEMITINYEVDSRVYRTNVA